MHDLWHMIHDILSYVIAHKKMAQDVAYWSYLPTAHLDILCHVDAVDTSQGGEAQAQANTRPRPRRGLFPDQPIHNQCEHYITSSAQSYILHSRKKKSTFK